MTRPLLLAALLLASAARAEPGRRAFPAGGHLAPADRLFVPSKPKVPAALVVMLHGCEQDADAVAAVTRWDALAEREGFFVLYPNQQWGRNPYNCWNWFFPYNQAAGYGEPAEIAASVRAVLALHPVDRARVFVAGLSSGGAEAAVMLACYPDLFAAGAVHSGVSYALVSDAAGALEVMKRGPEGRRGGGLCDPAASSGGALVVHGAADPVIAPANADRLVADFSGGPSRKVLVEGLGHAWSGGPAGLPYSDPKGPDATALMWAFFTGPGGTARLLPPDGGKGIK
ncbi:MAG: PHB depolymerase family esterase [Elusimicrobia bacterium]|nr:PHB depolymerase family esterase [Elusimicrobiota bacterium]